MFHEFKEHGKAVTQLLPFSNNGLVVSTSADDTIRIWSLQSLEEVYRFDLNEHMLNWKLCFLDENQIYYWNKESIVLASLRYVGEGFASFK